MIFLQAGALGLGLSEVDGCLQALRVSGIDLLPPDRRGPLLRLAAGEQVEPPRGVAQEAGAGTLVFTFAQTSVRLNVQVRPTHLTLRVVEITGTPPEALLWGPIPTVLREVVGETVGVVQGQGVAVGWQGLGVETTGGWPRGLTDPGCPDEAGRAGARPEYSECAAWRTGWGSVLQGYSTCSAPADPAGWGIAVFACPSAEALDVIGAIEVAEGLPHPTLGGTWVKRSQAATCAYLITDFGEADMDLALDAAEAAGLGYVYHPDPFMSWGHYGLRPGSFPDGAASLRRCVQRASARGIGLGVHTLSNFLSTHDPYVTPGPDQRLQRAAIGRLGAHVDAAATELPVEDPEPFRARGWLSTVAIGDELIRYEAVSDGPPWRLLDCERGAFGTAPQAHAAGAPAGKLADHGYRVFFPNLDLQDEVADRLAALFAETGLRQISFDGLEGCQETGRGVYAEARFVQRSARGWTGEVINDASRLTHFTWHGHTRMNWGEPWGAGMRQGQTEYRFANQEYFARNLFPPMLGWFQMRLGTSDHEATTLDDIEWMLARAAGYNAGFALVSGLDILRGNGCTDAILAAVRAWEAARHAGAFSPPQRERLRVSSTEWHLEADPATPGSWRLWPVALSPVLACRPGARQPGQPGGADWRVANPYGDQIPGLRLRASGAAGLRDPGFSCAGRTVIFRCRLAVGQYLIHGEDGQAYVCDHNWNRVRAVPAEGGPLLLPSGMQPVSFSAEMSDGATAEVRWLLRGGAEVARPDA